MAAAKKRRREKKPYVWPESVSYQALPYRPIRKLRPTDEPIDWLNRAEGFRAKEFVDDRGILYQRQRFGDWERWYLILEKIGDEGEVLYHYDAEKTPVNLGDDAFDRYDDFEFALNVFYRLVQDATDTRIFGPDVFVEIQKHLKKLGPILLELQREIQVLQPAEMEEQ